MPSKTKVHEQEKETEQPQVSELEATQAALANTDTAISAKQANITEKEQQLEQLQHDLDALNDQVAASLSVVRDIEQQLEQQETLVRKASVAADMTHGVGGKLESERAEHNQRMLDMLTSLQEQLSTARKQHSEREQQAHEEKGRIHQQSLDVHAELAALRGELDDLKGVREDIHAKLGACIFADLERQVTEAKQKESELEAALQEASISRSDAQYTIDGRLAEWPELRKQAKKAFGAHHKRAQSYTERKLLAFDRFLEELEVSEEISETHTPSQWTYKRIVELLTLDTNRLVTFLSLTPGFNSFQSRPMGYVDGQKRLAALGAWRQQLSEYLREHQREVESGRYYLDRQ
jgi:chromosome segregation ATPase